MIGPATELVQWAQVLAPVIAAIAAVASWRSANASRITAGRADQTSRRAAEALGRVTRPALAVLLSGTDERARTPHPMNLYVRNDAPHDGYLLAVRLHGPDGALLAELSNLSVQLGTAGNQQYVPLGKVPRVRPDVAPGEEHPSPTITWTAEFSDAAGLMSWRQHGQNDEMVRFDPDGTDTAPYYLYNEGYRSQPTALEVEPGPPPRRRWWRRRRAA